MLVWNAKTVPLVLCLRSEPSLKMEVSISLLVDTPAHLFFSSPCHRPASIIQRCFTLGEIRQAQEREVWRRELPSAGCGVSRNYSIEYWELLGKGE